MGRPLLALCLLVVLAGCGGAPSGPPTEAGEPTTTVATTTEPPVTTPAAEPTVTTTETPERAANPWGRVPVVVGIDGSADPGRNYTEQVGSAIEFWLANGTGGAGWEPAFRLEPNHPDPDVVVRFVSDIRSCGPEPTDLAIGCAPRLHADAVPGDPAVVLVNMGLTNDSTYRVVRHELGHVLGLDHGEGPPGVMAPYARTFDRVIRVYYDHGSSPTAVRVDREEQARRALEYYAGGADGLVTEEVEFAVVRNRSEAAVVIAFEEDGGNSTARWEGRTFVIEVRGILVQHTGWHVGYWLGTYFGAASVEELPPPFDDPERDPRSQWWH